MNCLETRKYLSAFVDDELDTRTNIDVVEHLRMCKACGAQLAEAQALNDAVSSAVNSVRAPESLRARLKAGILDREAHGRRYRAIFHDFSRNGWVRSLTAAASIMVVFTLVYAVLLKPPVPLNSLAMAEHIAVLRDQVPAFYHTTNTERAEKLALSTMKEKPDVTFLNNGQFRLVGAGPSEIEFKRVGHFLFRYKADVVSMFVFEGLSLEDVGGTQIDSPLGNVKMDSRRGLSLLSWQQGNFTFVLVSRLTAKEVMTELAPQLVTR
jgi:hypothetical protein